MHEYRILGGSSRYCYLAISILNGIGDKIMEIKFGF